jgi:hypothetical protein
MKALLIKAAKHGVAQVLGVILFLGGAGIGVSLLTAPTIINHKIFAYNFLWASPVTWGVIFLVASMLLVVTVLMDTRLAQLPALLLGAVFIVFGCFTLLAGVTPVVWAFVALGWVSIFTQIVCWAEDKRETSAGHN